MKRIELRDDDDGQFGKELTSDALAQYKKLTKEVRRMVKQQSKSFWIKFVTSYRANYIKSNLDPPYESQAAEEIANQEGAFIDILKLLTEEKRFCELPSLADSIGKFFNAATTLIQSRSRISLTSVSLIAQATSKFEPPLDTILVYTRFVRSLVELYNKWKHAPRECQRTPPAKWNPPSHWIDSTKSPSIYEQFLWDKWGRRLYGMLGVNREEIHLFEKPHHPNSASGDKSASHTLKRKTNTPAVKKVPNGSKTKKGRRKRGTQRNYTSSIPKSKPLSDPAAMEAAFEETSMDMDDCGEHSIHELKNNDYSVTENMNATANENNTNKGRTRNLGGTNHNITISEAEEASGYDGGTETDTEEYFMETAEHKDLFDHSVDTENKMETEEYRDIQRAKYMARNVNKISKPLSHVYGTKTDKYNVQSAKDPRKNVNRDNNSHNVSTSKPCVLVTTTSRASRRNRNFFDYSKLFGVSRDTNASSNEDNKSEPSKSSNFFTDTNVNSNDENKSEPSKSSNFFTDSNVNSNDENKSEPSKSSKFFNYGNLFHFSEHKSILKRKVSNESFRSRPAPETDTSRKTASGKTSKRKPDKYSAKDMAKNASEEPPSHVYVMESDSEQSALDLRKNGNRENNTHNVSIGNDKSHGFITLSETTSSRTTTSANAKFFDYSKLFDTNIQSNKGSVKHQQKSSKPHYDDVFYFGEQNSFSKVDSNDNPESSNSTCEEVITKSRKTASSATSKHITDKYNDIPSAIDMRKNVNDEYGAFSFCDYGMKSESEQSPIDLRKNVNRENITHNVSIGNSKPHGFVSPSETTTSTATASGNTFFDHSKLFAFNMDTNDQYDEENVRATTSGNTTFFDHSKHFVFNMDTNDQYNEENARSTTSGNTTFFDHSKHFGSNMDTNDQYNEENARSTTSGNTTFFDHSKHFGSNMDTNYQYNEENAKETTSGNTKFFDRSKFFAFNMDTNEQYDDEHVRATTSGNSTFFDHSKHFGFNMNTSDQYNEENARETTSGNTTFFDYSKIFDFRTNENVHSNDNEIHRMKEHDTFVNYANTYEQTEIIGNTEQKYPSSFSSRKAEDNVNKKEHSKDTDYFMYDRLFKFQTGQTSEHTEKMEDDIDVVGDGDNDGAAADDDVHIGFSDHENSPNGGFNPNGYNGFNPFEDNGFSQYGYTGYNSYVPVFGPYEFYSHLFALFQHGSHEFGSHGFSPYSHGHFEFGGIPFFQSQAAFFESLIDRIKKCPEQKPVKPVKKYLLQKCNNCNMLEKETESFEECADCIKSKISYVYCGILCKDVHWQRDHKKF